MTDQAPFSTSDLFDVAPGEVDICDLPFQDLGGVKAFSGRAATVRTAHHGAVREILAEPGEGRVLVVEAFASPPVAMLGDRLAGRAIENGWSGMIVKGAVRDVRALAGLAIGVKALSRTARRALDVEARFDSGISIELGQVVVSPGDWIFADEDAVLLARRNLLLE